MARHTKSQLDAREYHQTLFRWQRVATIVRLRACRLCDVRNKGHIMMISDCDRLQIFLAAGGYKRLRVSSPLFSGSSVAPFQFWSRGV